MRYLRKNVIGSDLKKSLLIMFNKIKEQQIIPFFMNNATITTVPKKGSRLLLENERGIFRVPVIRTILMRLIYNEKYETIDGNMSENQMGARKNKGCRNNILIIKVYNNFLIEKGAHLFIFWVKDCPDLYRMDCRLCWANFFQLCPDCLLHPEHSFHLF